MPVDLAGLLEPSRAALLLMECQEGIIGGGGKLGALADAVASHGTVGQIQRVLGARHARVPVFHLTMARRADGGGAVANCLLLAATARRGIGLLPGSPQQAVVAELAPLDDEYVLTRFHGLTPFHATELDQLLRNLGVRTVVATGVSVNIGITGLVLDAVNAGYQVVVPREAVAGTPDAYVDMVFEHTLRLLATVAPVAEVERDLERTMSQRRFEGRVVFVTGGGSGIGRATAALFAEEGASVFAVDVNRDGLAETVSGIRQADGSADGTHCDVANPESVRDAVAKAVETFGGLNVLVNAAGIGGFLRFEELSVEEFQRTIGVNLGGTFNTVKAALPHLLRPPVGNVVNVASTAAMRGTAYAAHYAASKAGLLNLTRSLALEFASRDLRFNCICPGGVRTPLGRFFLRRDDFEAHLIDYQAPPKLAHFADPIDIARTIAYLASDEARMINGVALLADGGTLA